MSEKNWTYIFFLGVPSNANNNQSALLLRIKLPITKEKRNDHKLLDVDLVAKFDELPLSRRHLSIAPKFAVVCQHKRLKVLDYKYSIYT